MNRAASRAAAAVLMTVLTACSSDDGDSAAPTTVSASTREEYVVAADDICRRVEEQVAGPREELTAGAGATPDKAVALVPEVVGPARSGIGELRGLTPPTADGAAVAALLKEMEAALAELDRAAAAAAAGDGAALDNAITAWSERTSMIQETQREFGFKVCGVAAPPDLSELTADQQQFIAAGDALCRAADAAVEPHLSLVFGGDPAQAAGALATVSSIFGKMVDGLAALVPPPEDEARITSILDGQRGGLAVLADAQRLAAAGQAEAFQETLNQLDTAFGPSERAFRDYGFRQCGSQ